METTVLATALIMIALGVLVKRYPIIIAGYNTLSNEEKTKVDVKGLSSFVCNSFVLMGMMPLIAYYICLWLGHADWAGMSMLLPIIYLPYLFHRASSFDKSEHHRRSAVAAISVITMILVAIFMLHAMRPSHVKYDNGNIEFSGMFGTSYSISEIESIHISDTIPSTTLRINGISFAGINKGKFKLSDGMSCRFYLSSTKAPYIVFTDYSGKEIYFNDKTAEKTNLIYKQLEPVFRK